MTENVSATWFDSLPLLQERHKALLRAGEASEPDIEDFLHKARETGVILAESSERDLAQSTLNYWSAELIRRGSPRDVVLLREFDLSIAPDLEKELCPYVGLRAFYVMEEPKFFGRGIIVEKIVTLLKERRLVIVSGMSGSGKSSIVRAGVVPCVTVKNLFASVFMLVPGTDSLLSLAKAVSDEGAPDSAVAELAQRLLVN
jgi:hypothetical protein